MRERTGLNYLGLMRSVASWARIGRELCLELSLITDLSITEQRGFLYDRNFPLPERLVSSLSRERNRQAELAFIYPPLYSRLKARFCCAGLVYETTVLPEQWVRAVNEHLDLLWIPNIFNRDIAISSGVKVPVVVSPYGINGDFRPCSSVRKKGKFRFLCLAMPQKRKNLAGLIRSFYSAFPREKGVELFVKLPYEGGKNAFEYRTGELRSLVRDSRVILNTQCLDEEGLRDFYCSGDCYVQPSLSEGFGMAILEAMACGVPVIATAFGGPAEFLTRDNAYIVSHREAEAREIQYDNNSVRARIGCPEEESLVQCLKEAFGDRQALRLKAKQGLLTAGSFHWDRTAQELVTAITDGCS